MKLFFPNSGTLKGSSRLFKESQGVPARSADRRRLAAIIFVFALKTNTFSTLFDFLGLGLPKKLVKPMKNQHFCFWDLPSRSKKLVKPMNNHHFCVFGPSWAFLGRLWASSGRLGGILGRPGASWERLAASWARLRVSCVYFMLTQPKNQRF